MRESHKGVPPDTDRRSREIVPARRVHGSREWISLSGRLAPGADESEDDPAVPVWLPLLPLCLAGFRGGRLPLLLDACACRRSLFREPVEFSHALAIRYLALPASLADELAWLREIGVRQVTLPLAQDELTARQRKTLETVRNLHAEGVRITLALQPRRGAQEEPEAWHHFCREVFLQIGWQLEGVQLGDGLAEWFRDRRGIHAATKLFANVPVLRGEFPGVALLAPGLEDFRARLSVQTLRGLLPDGYAWDRLTLRAPAWQELASVGRDAAFLLHLTLACAVARRSGSGRGKVRVLFPPPPAGCGAAAEERIAGCVARRTMLALASGVADRTAMELDPSVGVAERQIFSLAFRELNAQLEGARFERRIPAGNPEGDFVLEFSRVGQPPLLVGWTDGEPRPVSVPFRTGEVNDFLRRPVPMLPHPRIRLTRNMAYFAGAA